MISPHPGQPELVGTEVGTDFLGPSAQKLEKNAHRQICCPHKVDISGNTEKDGAAAVTPHFDDEPVKTDSLVSDEARYVSRHCKEDFVKFAAPTFVLVHHTKLWGGKG